MRSFSILESEAESDLEVQMVSGIHRFEHHAMATPWVVSVAGEDPDTAGWAAS